ncbi:hypothetical protein [Calothrix sp. NIES-2100]|uniref:hypothetical protein n=1 Tax=Calothrix sp. NIES-2100 TaxID=1954172 RepID=UPI0030DB5D61
MHDNTTPSLRYIYLLLCLEVCDGTDSCSFSSLLPLLYQFLSIFRCDRHIKAIYRNKYTAAVGFDFAQPTPESRVERKAFSTRGFANGIASPVGEAAP